MKFEPRGSVTLRLLSTGNFALYPLGGIGSPFWIGPICDVEEAYSRRPAPAVRVHVPKVMTVSGIDLTKMEINI